MMFIKYFWVLVIALIMSFVFSACGIGEVQQTNPTTIPTGVSTPPETKETQPEETTTPTETEPEETEPQIQSREPEGVRMTLDQLQMFQWKLAEDEEHWYTVLFGTTFTNPAEMKVKNFFGNGMPYSNPVELTQEEMDALAEQRGGELKYSVWRISREKVEEVLANYLNLSPEEMAEVNWTGMYYLESTDCYYGHGGGSMVVWPIFREGYILDDDTRVIYYTHYQAGDHGSEGSALYRAVLWNDPEVRADTWKILEITEVNP